MPNTKIITINGINMTEIADAVHDIMTYRRSNGLGAIALQPHPLNEDYIRSRLNGKNSDFDFWKTGHYILLVRYSQIEDCPLFCINKETFEADIKTITDYLASAENKDLAAVVNHTDRHFFEKEFPKYNFELI